MGELTQRAIDQRAVIDAEAAPYIGRAYHVEVDDCCLSVRFDATFTGAVWRRSTYTYGPDEGRDYWNGPDFRFANGVVMTNGFDPSDPEAMWVVPEGYRPTTIAPLSTCRGRTCGALVQWCITPAGKKSPHDRDGTSHYATCPDAEDFRR